MMNYVFATMENNEASDASHGFWMFKIVVVISIDWGQEIAIIFQLRTLQAASRSGRPVKHELFTTGQIYGSLPLSGKDA